MTTLETLRNDILFEINRENDAQLTTARLNETVREAIKFYEDTRLTFNEFIRTVTTTADAEYVAEPTGLLDLDQVQITVGGHEYQLSKHSWTYIERLQGASDTSGQPSDYAYENGQFRLWPTPSTTYTLNVSGLYQLTTLNGDADTTTWANSDSNAWTTTARVLIKHRCKFTLARDYLFDREILENARLGELEAFGNLKRKANKLQATGRVKVCL